jgi:N-acetylmuramoyl-L-alanine amidase
VQKGEYLALIAKKYGTTVAKIVSYNHLSNANTLKVGQKLKIPKNK